ncbi:hypothetical protein STIUS_v1c05650 [Spiroplasma sp. TIUS-1]|uniref:hypothetical protein n=1 Tax=Spiroplasma sp. TIUS-1 TaxID=216963 RepID=UPI0013970E4C|nr:hypothetical protein [Spiroplasma sp. TIUS-1]QHX36119.1 hypothetical protein STIUS_v1c05650 [Spiroplasma sp. TIUS-1]
MLKNQLIKKLGWISLLVMPTIYIPSVIVYKTIHYLNSGVDVIQDAITEEVESENKININDELGFIEIGPLNNINVFNVIQRINLIKKTNFDYRDFNINMLSIKDDIGLAELIVKKESSKYTQDENVLVEYSVQKSDQLEFTSKSIDINFSLFEKIDIVKFERDEVYIDKDNFEMIFNKKFLKLEPLSERVELKFSYDHTNKPKNVKAIYVGFNIPFEWSYSIESK